MPLNLGDDSLETIELPHPGEWVRVKRRLSLADERAIVAATLRGQRVVPGQGVELDAGALYEHARWAVLDLAIREWSFTDTAGKPIPVTPAAIRCLDEASVDALTEALNRLYPDIGDASPLVSSAGANSGSNGATPSSVAGASPVNSDGSQ